MRILGVASWLITFLILPESAAALGSCSKSHSGRFIPEPTPPALPTISFNIGFPVLSPFLLELIRAVYVSCDWALIDKEHTLKPSCKDRTWHFARADGKPRYNNNTILESQIWKCLWKSIGPTLSFAKWRRKWRRNEEDTQAMRLSARNSRSFCRSRWTWADLAPRHLWSRSHKSSPANLPAADWTQDLGPSQMSPWTT